MGFSPGGSEGPRGNECVRVGLGRRGVFSGSVGFMLGEVLKS